MDLKEYLALPGQSQTEFAKRLGVSQGMVWQWSNGKTPVTPERAAQIERETGGQVTRPELRPSDWWLVWPELATAPERLRPDLYDAPTGVAIKPTREVAGGSAA